MAKAGFYAVAKGRVPGIYPTWQDCEPHVKGYPGARYKKFKTLWEAEDFVATSPSALPVTSTATSTSTSTSTSTALVPSSSRRSSLSFPLQKTSDMSRFSAKKRGGTPRVDVLVKEDDIDEGDYDVVYADGACKGNGQQIGSVAGIGVWWGRNDKRNLAERCPGPQTNNRAELIAIGRALETAPLARPLIIKTDSIYSIKCLGSWHQTWAHCEWKTSTGKSVRNASLIRYIISLIQRRESQGFPVKLIYVRGHAGIEGNEGADAQANLGAMMPERPERDWEKERTRVEESMKEGEEDEQGPELIDKCIQCVPIEIEDTDEEPDMEVTDHATSGGDVPVYKSGPRLEPDSTSELTSKTDGQTVEFRAKQRIIDEIERVCVGFRIEDLLSPEELDAEVAEALKS